MLKLNDQPITMDDLRSAGDAIETLIEMRGYLPPSGDLVRLAARFRDDIREVLGMPWLGHPFPPQGRGPLAELDDERYNLLDLAVGVLVGRYTRYMDDPELAPLLRDLRAVLVTETARRAGEKIGALWTAKACPPSPSCGWTTTARRCSPWPPSPAKGRQGRRLGSPRSAWPLTGRFPGSSRTGTCSPLAETERDASA